jgi:hypothetical protein
MDTQQKSTQSTLITERIETIATNLIRPHFKSTSAQSLFPDSADFCDHIAALLRLATVPSFQLHTYIPQWFDPGRLFHVENYSIMESFDPKLRHQWSHSLWSIHSGSFWLILAQFLFPRPVDRHSRGQHLAQPNCTNGRNSSSKPYGLGWGANAPPRFSRPLALTRRRGQAYGRITGGTARLLIKRQQNPVCYDLAGI